MKILGLDPANLTGWCWCDGTQRHYGTWRLARGKDEPPGLKLIRLEEAIIGVARIWGIDRIGFELASFGEKKNPHTMGEHFKKQAVIEKVAVALGVPCEGYQPTSIKAHAGNGRAKKADMIRMAKLFFQFEPEDDNQADAIFVESLTRQRAGQPLAETKRKPEGYRAAKRHKDKTLF